MLNVTLHEYITDPALPQKDGVNLAHDNICALMRSQLGKSLDVVFHDFNRLLVDDDYARNVLETADCVISNVGPHAHYYFHLRDRLGLNYRIFRDVRTAIWSSYLLQEYLCAPLLREEDVLMVASHYTRGVYEKLFPHLKDHPCFLCYPLTVNFPDKAPPRKRKTEDETLILGYIGRLSEDKNFPDLVALLIELNRANTRKFKLLACGDVHSPSCAPDYIQSQVNNALGDGDFYEYLPARPHREIWNLLTLFDVMLFPSTSNLETLGRVLIEASYAGLPVVCGAHAAAPELMPTASLCQVTYDYDKSYSAHFDHRMGKIEISELAEKIVLGKLEASRCHENFLKHPRKFIEALHLKAAEISAMDPLVLEPAQQALIKAIEVELPPPVSVDTVKPLIETMTAWFLGLQNKDSPEYPELASQLLERSTYPQRTQSYLTKSALTRADFTNVGGIDIELCHIARFYPHFSMKKN